MIGKGKRKSMKLLTKNEVLRVVQTSKTDFVKRLAKTAYDALARAEELEGKIGLLTSQINSIKQDAERFAGSKASELEVDKVNDELWRLREQLEATTRPLVAVLVYHDGKVHVLGDKDQIKLVVAHVPNLPSSMTSEREEVLTKQLTALHRDAIAKRELKIIGRGESKLCQNMTSYQLTKALRVIHRLSKDNATLKALLTEEPAT